MRTKENLLEAAHKGGLTLQQKAIQSYLEHPSVCLMCKQIIPLNGCKPAIVKRKKFCNHSCAAKHNNSGQNRWKNYTKTHHVCSKCGKKFRYKLNLCRECRKETTMNALGMLTKSEAQRHYKSRVEHRAAIGSHSELVVRKRAKQCVMCGYGPLVDICHIKAVRDFPPTALLNEINSPNNLIILCPNHHREFDKGWIKLEEMVGVTGVEPASSNYGTLDS